MKKQVKNIVEVLQLLKAAEVYDKYLTPAGQGFLDGITSIEEIPETILKSKYENLQKENNNLKDNYNLLLKDYNKLKNKKGWLK